MSTLYVQVEGGNITTLQPPGCIHPLTQDDDDDDDDDDETLTAPSDTHMQEDLEELSPPEASLPGTSQSDKSEDGNGTGGTKGAEGLCHNPSHAPECRRRTTLHLYKAKAVTGQLFQDQGGPCFLYCAVGGYH
ncbi:hypothetical protein PBY51_000111 [Eleginops maclovinus]|uniref:Uncharacterized protein n=1 Tax=Eleginops maclovinus TaxID=56733 RepID=A0AAN8AK93_ELEMC|nr:hypothetical protein PBY51_000111 [Eleginops maclovinus]